jgi:hypothetical protein
MAITWTKYLSRRWLTHVAGLVALVYLAMRGTLTWEAVVGISAIVASEGGTNILDHLVAIRSGGRDE